MPSLGIRGLKLGYAHIPGQTVFYFLFVGKFQKKINRFPQVCRCFPNRLSLAGNVQFGTTGNKPIPITFDKFR